MQGTLCAVSLQGTHQIVQFPEIGGFLIRIPTPDTVRIEEPIYGVKSASKT
jgi:hypothetical protein